MSKILAPPSGQTFSATSKACSEVPPTLVSSKYLWVCNLEILIDACGHPTYRQTLVIVDVCCIELLPELYLCMFFRIMDEAAEQQAQVSEIDKLISTTITDADEVELEAELDMLLGTVSSKDLPDIPINLDVDMPSVPEAATAAGDAVTPTQNENEAEMVAA